MPDTPSTCKSIKFIVSEFKLAKTCPQVHYTGLIVCRQTSSVFDQHTGAEQRLRGLFTIAPPHTCAVYVPAVGVFALDVYAAQVMTDFIHQHVTTVRNESDRQICMLTSRRRRRYKHVHTHADEGALTIFKTAPPSSQPKHLHNPSYTGCPPPFAAACEIFVSIDLISSQGWGGA